MGNLDLLDEEGNKTGEVIEFLDAHRTGKWHACAHVWVYNSKGEVLLQKRGPNVMYPNLWDISAAGHVDSGEEADQAALRELFKETGIKVDKLKKVDVLIQDINDGKIYNREFDHIYMLKYDSENLNLNQSEVSELKFMPIDQFEKELNDKDASKKYMNYGDYYKVIIKALRKELSEI